MTSLAICATGSLTDSDRSFLTDKYSTYAVTFFVDMNDDIVKSMYNLSTKKRQTELQNCTDYDVCMWINASHTKSLAGTSVIYSTLHPMTVYFHSGSCGSYSLVDIAFTMFYATSIIFDRVCEMYLNTHTTSSISRLCPSISLGQQLYAHIKSMMIKTECINVKDSSVFIGSTSVN